MKPPVQMGLIGEEHRDLLLTISRTHRVGVVWWCQKRTASKLMTRAGDQSITLQLGVRPAETGFV